MVAACGDARTSGHPIESGVASTEEVVVLARRRKVLAALLAVWFLLPLAFAAPAGAGVVGAQFRIQLDARPPVGQPWSFLRYFPRTLSVHQGDVVDAAWSGAGTPHTATAIPSGNPDA